MTRFPRIATHVGAADRVMRENYVGPNDDDEEDQDNDKKRDDSSVAIPAEPEES